MQDCTKFYVDGKWYAPENAETLDVINPATEEVCARISLGTEDDVDNAALAASRAFASYGFSSKNERIELFEKFDQKCMILSRLDRTHMHQVRTLQIELCLKRGDLLCASGRQGPRQPQMNGKEFFTRNLQQLFDFIRDKLAVGNDRI